jgi:hypothetical protein
MLNKARKLHAYRFKPKPRFHGVSPVQYGLELEVDKFPSNDHNRLGLTMLYREEKGESSCYVKTDGSLDTGFEIVFHPRDLLSWFNYKKKLEGISQAVVKAEGRSYDTGTCGIHVHRGRQDISSYHIVKMLYMLTKFDKLTRTVARRDPNSYCRAATGMLKGDRSPNSRGIFDWYKEIKQSGRYHHGERYVQLNFQNEKTIELRIFRGNLNVDSVLSCILFFDRLVEFTRKQSIKSMSLLSQKEMIQLFDDFCKKMTERSTLGKRKNNQFAIVGKAVTEAISARLELARNRLSELN